MKNVPNSVEKIDWILENVTNPDVDVRREAAGLAQYALLGYPEPQKAALLLEKLAERLGAKVNGHVMLNEPDEYVRERCANAFELACSTGKNIAKFVPVLQWSRDHDPHQWVKDMAREALAYYTSPRHDSKLPLPMKWKAKETTIAEDVKTLRARQASV